jgi:hypothetical protein
MSSETDCIIVALRETFPGVVEEWERQRSDGNEDWPTYHDEDGLKGWLDSEVRLTEDFIPTDETGQERKLQAFCIAALNHLRHEPREA